ncbi:MAG: T9SS type A sorting domain-containing protein [Bacteroidales bacterium]|nr:T9SS type A sorting domain-containing protein [Bacteroidales bacterium]
MYDHATQTEYDQCSTTYITGTNGSDEEMIGYDEDTEEMDPFMIAFTTTTPSQTFEVSLSANPTEGGTVAGEGTFDEGSQVTVTATANEGFSFVNWTENNEVVSTSASYSFTIANNIELVANFEETTTTPDYPWTVINEGDGSTMAINAEIQINGVPVTEADRWELGAFCGDVCRGDRKGLGNGPFGLVCYLTVYGTEGDVLSFALYDMTNEEVHPGVCETTVTYVPQGHVGEVWEPFILNFVTAQTFTKPILGYDVNEGDGHYYLIASPIGDVSPENVTNMLSNSYDLYYFDQNASDGLEWINYKDQNDGGYSLEAGKGYLYANSQNVTLTFTGMAYNGDGKVTLVKNAEDNPNGGFEGWNLVGNPFAQKASFTKEFYTMKSDGSEIIAGTEKVVEAMEGLFVIAENDGEEMTFTPITENTEGDKGLIFDLKQNSAVVDRAIVRLEGSNNLPKMMLHPNNTKVYIPQADKDYAVMGVNRDMDESMPLNLKVAENGTYTLAVTNEEDNLEYLALLDHKTGMQVNLLLTPNYQFSASTNDAAGRFTVFFRSMTGLDEQSNPICFRNNGLLTVSGLEGAYALEVIDVMGRILSNTTVNGEYSQVMELTPGLYTIRLRTADKTYTKKIVVD